MPLFVRNSYLQKGCIMNFKEKLFEKMFLLFAAVSVVAVFIICIFLFVNGFPAMMKIGVVDFLFGTRWQPTNNIYGIFPMIVGSIYITGLAIAIGVPISIMTSIFIVYFCPKYLYVWIKPSIDVLAGIPSIVYGFFGMVILVPLVRTYIGGNGNSILTASILLAIMIIPTVIVISESAIRAVPKQYYESSRALGATHERSIFWVMVPAAKSGILASIVLAIGRAIGETMAVIMIAGNQPRLTGDILQGIRTLTANIVIEMKYASGLHEDALIATGVVLFVFILFINLSFSVLTTKQGGK